MQGFFKNGNFSHVIQLEHFSLQSSKSIFSGSQHEELCANYEDACVDSVWKF